MRILVVEDNEFMRRVFREFLEPFDYEIYDAASGQDALALLNAKRPVDLVISDLVMPSMNAWQLYEVLREVQESVSMLIVTSYPMPQTGASLVQQPGIQWMSKPVSIERFGEVVSMMMKR